MRVRRSASVVLLGALAMVAGLTLSVGLLAERAPAQSRPAGIRLVQFNMCGHVCNGDRRVAGIADALAEDRADAVSLNEVCRGQLDAVLAGLRRRGWSMDARFLVTQPTVCGGDDYGIAVLTRARILDTDTLTYRVQAPGTTERRGIVCAAAALAGRPSRVCSTHLVSGGEDRSGSARRGQLGEAARLTGGYIVPVVLMGDFNLPPGDASMAALYTSRHGAAAGRLDEVAQGQPACRCGSGTHSGGEKLDYVFVSARDFMIRSASVVAAATSDHDVLRGVVTAR